MPFLGEFGKNLGKSISIEHQAYRALAENLAASKDEPKGPLAPIAKTLQKVTVEVYIAPLFYAERRLVQGHSPEKIQKHEKEMLNWKKQVDS